MNEPELIYLFPTTVYLKRIDDHERYDRAFNSDLDQYLFRNENDVMTGESLGKIFMHHNTQFTEFFRTIAVEVRIYLNKMGIRDELLDIYITKSWLSITETDDYHMAMHTHTVSDVSFVYYLEVPDNSDVISFAKSNPESDLFGWLMHSDNNLKKNFINEYVASNISTFFVQPEQGMLLLFAGRLSHGTKPNPNATGPFKGRRIAVVGDISLHLKPDQLDYEMGRISPEHMRKF